MKNQFLAGAANASTEGGATEENTQQEVTASA